MAKTCPSCGYSPIGPFTDNCPICAEPVRNVRSSAGGSAPPGSMPPWLRWVLGGAVVTVVAVLAVCWILGIWPARRADNDVEKLMTQMKAAIETQRRTRMVVVTAADLLQQCQNDPASERKYQGKYLEISGIVERCGKDGDQTPFVILHGGDQQAKLKIECFFDDADEGEAARIVRLSKGQTITVRGEYDGRVSHLQIRECVLVR